VRRFVSVALALARRNIRNWLVSPTLLVPSIGFPLFFLVAFAGGLSVLDDATAFDYPPGYTAFQFVFIALQRRRSSASLPASPSRRTSSRASGGGCCWPRRTGWGSSPATRWGRPSAPS
jgi:hypothetical protein